MSETIKVTVVGVVHRKGTSSPQKGGKPYDFHQVNILKPIEISVDGDRLTEGYGFEVQSIDLAADALRKFSDIKFPATLELEVGSELGWKGIKSVVTGFKAVKLASAA